uniref:Uncharacterized protein n=1 Tax=Romanomermis culicivorax TaxID=13658 RepID=A0A915HL12_ROMCU
MLAKNLEKAATTSKSYYDKKAKHGKIAVNNLVLLVNSKKIRVLMAQPANSEGSHPTLICCCHHDVLFFMDKFNVKWLIRHLSKTEKLFVPRPNASVNKH